MRAGAIDLWAAPLPDFALLPDTRSPSTEARAGVVDLSHEPFTWGGMVPTAGSPRGYGVHVLNGFA